ncbi:hypothetical protein EMGBS15_10800 [Filimonas sp.]|nr:hypothetical protein EMGBS15_10800 [Filimonas sp.]
MKLSWLLLAFYILVLSVIPCSDEGECDTVSFSTEQWQQQSHENHEHHKELCSPFCTCACCGISIAYTVVPFFMPVRKIDKVLERIIPFSPESYSKEISSIIWQPPRA